MFRIPRAGKQLAAGMIDKAVLDFAIVLGVVQPSQLGLGIEQIDMRRPTPHEQEIIALACGRK